MSYNYQQYVDTLNNMAIQATNVTDPNFTQIIPRVIEYAELRIYRELDFLTTRSTATATLVSSNRNVSVPGSLIIVESANVITPSTQTVPDNGTRNPIERVSLDVLNALYGGTATGQPKCYALVDNVSVVLGPKPDATYTTEFIGIVRPAPLAPPGTSTTFLTTNLPDLFLAASMIFISGYQQNFGTAENPGMAQSWDAQYQALKQGIDSEELRKKAASVSWTPFIPTPIANVSRETPSGAPAQ